jgi:WD40 repeat protein
MPVTACLSLWLLLFIAAALPAAPLLADSPPAPKVAATPTQTLRYAEETCGSPEQPIAFSPSGLLVMGCESGKARVVHALTGQLLWETAPLPKLKWLSYADASTLVAVSADKVVVVFDATTRAERLRLTLPGNGEVKDVQVAGSTLLVTTKKDAKHDTLKALSLTDGALLSEATVKGRVHASALSSDGLRAAWAITGEPVPTLAWAPIKALTKPTATASLCASPPTEEGYVPTLDAFTLRFSPSGDVVAALTFGDERADACIVSLSDPSKARFVPLSWSDHLIESALQFSADGALLRVVLAGGAIDREGYSWGGLSGALIDVVEGAEVDEAEADSEAAAKADAAAWQYDRRVLTLPDGQTLWALSFTGNGSSVSALLAPGESRPLRYLPHGDLSASRYASYGLAVGPDARAVVIHDHQRALILNGADPKRPITQAPFDLTWSGLSEGEVSAHVFDDGAGGGYVVVTEKETLTRWELGKSTPISTYTAPAYILRVDAGATPDEVITCHASNQQVVFSVVNTRTGEASALADAPKLASCPIGGSTRAGTDRFLINNGYPSYSISASSRKGEVVANQNLESGPSRLGMSPDGQHVLIDPTESVAMILRADSFDTALTLKEDDIDAFAFSPDSQWLAVSQAETSLISLIHLPSLTTTALTSPSTVGALAFSSDSATLHSLHPEAHSLLTWAIPKP